MKDEVSGRSLRILDVDLDFFLSGISYGGTPAGARLEGASYAPWREQDVTDFLERRCGLSTAAPLPGKVVITHDEVFYDWRERVGNGSLSAPFEVVHVDAHADLGMGDAAYDYIMTELLAKPVAMRGDPPRDPWSGVNEGNYLAFAIACRWVSRLTYVRHERGGDDILPCYMKDNDEDSGSIQLKYFGDVSVEALVMDDATPLAVEPEVPFQVIPGSSYLNEQPFDLMYLALSPSYTPESADGLILIIREYMKEG